MEDKGSWVQGNVVVRFDFRFAPSLLLRPRDRQNMIRGGLAKHKLFFGDLGLLVFGRSDYDVFSLFIDGETKAYRGKRHIRGTNW